MSGPVVLPTFIEKTRCIMSWLPDPRSEGPGCGRGALEKVAFPVQIFMHLLHSHFPITFLSGMHPFICMHACAFDTHSVVQSTMCSNDVNRAKGTSTYLHTGADEQPAPVPY